MPLIQFANWPTNLAGPVRNCSWKEFPLGQAIHVYFPASTTTSTTAPSMEGETQTANFTHTKKPSSKAQMACVSERIWNTQQGGNCDKLTGYALTKMVLKTPTNHLHTLPLFFLSFFFFFLNLFLVIPASFLITISGSRRGSKYHPSE